MLRTRLFMVTAATVAIILALGSLLMLGAFSGGGSSSVASAQQPDANDGTISVTGEGQVSQGPDAARVIVGVEFTGDGLNEVLSDANERMNSVILALTDEGIPEDEIQTQEFAIRVERDHEAGNRPITGYTVVNLVQVTITPIEHIADVIDSAVDAGANHVGNIAFTVQDREAAVRQAREQAMEHAREKAAHFAELGGVSLGSVFSISEAGTTSPAPQPVAEEAADADMAPPIEPGQQTVSVTVNVVYSID